MCLWLLASCLLPPFIHSYSLVIAGFLLHPSPHRHPSRLEFPLRANKSQFCSSSASAPKQMHAAAAKNKRYTSYRKPPPSVFLSSILETKLLPFAKFHILKGKTQNITHFSYQSSPLVLWCFSLSPCPHLRTSNASYAFSEQTLLQFYARDAQQRE